ncbi:MAG: diacylglycerol/lipid kinase family protein [Acidimicrobiales bacterium]
MGRVPVLVSPEAGRGRAESAVAAILDTIRAAGLEPVDITGRDAAASLAAARAEVAEGVERLIVVGGDGQVHLGTQAVAETSTVLGVVPVGTGNDFARAFPDMLGTSPIAATRRALGPARAIDAIRTGHGWVASVATLGFSGDVNARANRLRFPRGPRRYTVATLLEIPRLKRHRVRLTVDNRVHDVEATLIAIANTGFFGGGMEICPAARPDDGRLEILVVGPIGRLALLRWFPQVFAGTHLRHEAATAFAGSSVTVDAEPVELWGDGEPLGPAPTTFTAVPGALRLAG